MWGLFVVIKPEEPGKVGYVDCLTCLWLLFAHSAEEWAALDLCTSVRSSRYELTLFMLQIFIEQNELWAIIPELGIEPLREKWSTESKQGGGKCRGFGQD